MHVALAALASLSLIHKLEYFLNARIVGKRIQAPAWELLIAMLAPETALAHRAWWQLQFITLTLDASSWRHG